MIWYLWNGNVCTWLHAVHTGNDLVIRSLWSLWFKSCEKIILQFFLARFFLYLARKASFLVQDLVQDLASLARKIIARFALFLQDSFYWETLDSAIFCDILSAMGHHSRLFHLENCCVSLQPANSWLPTTPTLHPYISVCGVDKTISDGRKIS